MKQYDIKSKNGFTLIELLAVIVILAILILLALPNVLQLMEKSRINSFKVEVTGILKQAETIYTDASISGGFNSKTPGTGGTDITRKPVVVGTGSDAYRYLCINIEDIKSNGFMDKDFIKQGYSGFIEIFVPNSGNAVYGINITNGTYAFEKTTLDDLGDSATQPKPATGLANSQCNAVLNQPVYTKDDYLSTTKS